MRRVVGLILALILSAFGGCAHAPPPEPKHFFHQDADKFYPAACSAHWQAKDRPILLVSADPKLWLLTSEAARVWNVVLGFEIFRFTEILEWPPSPFGRIVPVYYAPNKSFPEGAIGVTFFSLNKDCSILRAMVAINSVCPPELQYNVMVHELGHVLGLQHSESEESIMFWQAQELGIWMEPSLLNEVRALYDPAEDR